MAFESPEAAGKKQEVFAPGEVQEFTDLEKETGIIIRYIEEGNGDTTVSLSRPAMEGSLSVTEKRFAPEEREQAKQFYTTSVEALRANWAAHQDRVATVAEAAEEFGIPNA